MPETKAASHLPTLLRSATHPIFLRNPEEPRDAAVLSALLSDPENTKHDPHAAPISPEVAAKVIARMRESAAVPSILEEDSDARVASGPGRVNLVIVLVDASKGEKQQQQEEEDEEGVVIGLGGYGNIEERMEGGRKIRVGDVGAMVNPAYRGRGFATEAIRLAVDWAFRDVSEGGLQLDRVTATMTAANAPMIGLVEKKLGWKGVLRPGPEDGGAGNEVVFEVTKDTWRK